jgi:hypothetical protein
MVVLCYNFVIPYKASITKLQELEMSLRIKHAAQFLLVVGIGSFSLGCGQVENGPVAEDADVHAGHDHGDEGQHAHGIDLPEDLPSAVEALRKCYQEIKDAFESGKPDDAHEPLHHVGELLGATTKLATKAELDEQDEETVTNALGEMFEAYGRIDSSMHAGQTPDYAAESETLDSVMAKLEEVLAKPDTNEGP